MSLQIWLPLNGNLNNQGLEFTAAIGCSKQEYTNNGKLCEKMFTGSSDIVVNSTVLKNTKMWSYCYWGYVKSASVTANWTPISLIQDGGSNLRTEVCPSSFNNGIYCYSIHNNDKNMITNNYITSPTGGYYDKWAHFCLTSDGKTITKYINGVKTGTASYNGSGRIDGIFLFRNSHIVNKQDIRIYDNCLSAREVKELSKGLCLHYKLGGVDGYFTGRNLIPRAYRLNDKWSAAGGYVATTTVVADSDARCGYHIESKCTTAGAGPHYPVFGKTSDKIGKTYTWSFEAKCSSAKAAANIGHECGGLTKIALTTEWKKYKCTWKYTDAQYYSFTFYAGFSVGDILYIRDFKIEEGSKATPWTPAPEDNTALYNTTTEFDTSGYSNNGKIVAGVGSDSTSPRYDTSYTFNGKDQYISFKNILSKATTEFSFSFWMKPKTSGTYTFYTARTKLGEGLALFFINNFIRLDDNTQTNFDNYSLSGLLNQWIHVCITRDKSCKKLYINGNLVSTKKEVGDMGSIAVNATLGGAENSDNGIAVDNWINGSVSDYRIYTTALSAADVKELYNTPISLTNTGVLMTQGEFKEE